MNGTNNKEKQGKNCNEKEKTYDVFLLTAYFS